MQASSLSLSLSLCVCLFLYLPLSLSQFLSLSLMCFSLSLILALSIGVLFCCFGRKIDGPSFIGGFIIHQGHLFPGHCLLQVIEISDELTGQPHDLEALIIQEFVEHDLEARLYVVNGEARFRAKRHNLHVSHMDAGQNRFGSPFWGIGAPPRIEPICVGIGIFTGGTIWLLTHGQIAQSPGPQTKNTCKKWRKVETIIYTKFCKIKPNNEFGDFKARPTRRIANPWVFEGALFGLV